MNARELRTCLNVVMFAVLVTVNIQLFAILYVSTENNGKSRMIYSDCNNHSY